MKAIILAGGKGTRLAPLTTRTPKPLVRVLDQPVMAHILALLAHYGVKEAAVTVSYLAHEIRNRFGEEFGGIRLHYSHEESPLGTAGGVLAASELFGSDSCEDILVISGDAVCDFDLEKALSFHRERDAQATLLLKHSEHPLAYGVVKCGEDGAVCGFVEKPEWSEVCSDRVNTGIYFLKRSVLEQIPRNVNFDFSADLFPKMLAEKARLFGCLCDGYWRDIGSLSSYFACNQDALNNKIKLYLPMDGVILNARGGNWYCSYGASVHEDARICAGSILGRGSYVEADALIGNSILCDDCTVEKGAVVKDSILDRGVLVKRNALVGAQSVVGYGSQLGEGSHCLAQNLPAQSRLRACSYFSPEEDLTLWEEDRFVFRSTEKEVFFRLGQALAKCFPGPFFLSKQGEGEGYASLGEGLLSSHAKLLSSDAPFPFVSAYSALAMNGYALHLVWDEKGCSLQIFCPDGSLLERQGRRRLMAAFRSLSAEGKKQAASIRWEHLEARKLYQLSLVSCLPVSVEGLSLQVEEGSFLSEILALRSWKDSPGKTLCLRLDPGGEDCSAGFLGEEVVSFHRLQAFFAAEKGISLDAEREKLLYAPLADHRELLDPCYCLCSLLSQMQRHSPKTLWERLQQTQVPYCLKRFYSHDGTHGSFTACLEQLFRQNNREDLLFFRPQGTLRIVPSALKGFHVYARARKAEGAEELCNFALEKLGSHLTQPSGSS